jgi:hypothetical protein
MNPLNDVPELGYSLLTHNFNNRLGELSRQGMFVVKKDDE